ncbi:protein kinase [Arthrobacter citreus]|uniref:Protein kinase n=1 Tax=Arthrobacter citreus TaxID=1670 RepID=A0ABZ3A1V0_9MICC
MESYGAAGAVPAAERPPEVESGYRAGRLLGSGRAGRVWLAVRGHDGAHFALKTPAAAGDGPAGTFETRRELNILSRFEHENLLQLFTVLETSHGPGLLSEYAEGGSLVRIAAARGPLTAGEAVTVLVGIGSALAYLHGQGVSHGQITPGNILFSAQGKPLLGDLGTAQLFGTGSATGMPGGHGAADRTGPEAATGQSFAGPAGDVHALAALGWLALTGHPLPPRTHRPRLSALLPAVPPLLAEAIEAGLADDQDRRPDAAEFVRLVFASAVAEPLDLAMPVPSAGPEADSRRARTERGRAVRGLHRGRWSTLTEGRSRGGAGGSGPGISGGMRRGNRVPLSVAALLVAATMGVGAVAVAAPELLPGKGGTESSGPDAAAEEGGTTEGDPKQGEGALGEGGQPENEKAPGTPGPQEHDRGREQTANPPPDAGAETAGARGPLTETPEPKLQALVRGEDPVAAAGALAELRARAFSTANAELLDGVNIPGSSAMITDRAEIAKLAAAGTFLSGLSVEILSAGPVLPGEAGRVSLPAAVSTSAYAERDAGGGTVRNTAALSHQDIVLIMVRTPAGWRIEDILPAPA